MRNDVSELVFDSSKPDGTPRKRINVSWLCLLGSQLTISLGNGLSITYKWFKENIDSARLV